MNNERNYEEEIARRDREELEQITSEKEQNDLNLYFLNQDLEDVCMDIFELLGKIDRVKHMKDLEEDIRNSALRGFERKLREAKEIKASIEEKQASLRKDRVDLITKEEQNKNRQEATKKHAEESKRIEEQRQAKVYEAIDKLTDESYRLRLENDLLEFVRSHPDAFKFYVKNHDLNAVREKYGAEFETFLNNKDRNPSRLPIRPFASSPEVESEADFEVEPSAMFVSESEPVTQELAEDVVPVPEPEVEKDESKDMGDEEVKTTDGYEKDEFYGIDSDNKESKPEYTEVMDREEIEKALNDEIPEKSEVEEAEGKDKKDDEGKPADEQEKDEFYGIDFGNKESEPEYTEIMNKEEIENDLNGEAPEKPEDLLPNEDSESTKSEPEDVEKPEDLLPKSEVDVVPFEFESNNTIDKARRKVVAIVEHTKELIKELTDTKNDRES